MEEHMSNEEDIDQRLADLDAKLRECVDRCAYRSAHHLAKEIRRFAKTEQRLIPYMHGSFYLMNYASNVLEPELMRDTAIELVGLLESDEQARAIQADLPEAEYSYTVHWMTACAYDNLALATAILLGYNSDGMHQCISDGIQVCRRTGKLGCIQCFREYASEVYETADDLDLAMQFARMGIAHKTAGDQDRRWVSTKKLANLLLMKGDLAWAAKAAQQAWQMRDTFHNPLSASLETHLILRKVSCLSGDAERINGLNQSGDWQSVADPSAGEYPLHELRRDQTEAVEASCAGQVDRAIELVARWDRVLRQKKCFQYWLHNRLHLVALHRLAGNDQQVRTLSSEVKARAEESRDWLVLRCLARLQDASVRPTPLPLVADLNAGPYAVKSSVATPPLPASSSELQTPSTPTTASTTAPDDSVEGQDQLVSTKPDLPSRAKELLARLTTAREAYASSNEAEAHDTALGQILRDILAIDPATVTSAIEARFLLHTAWYARAGDVPGQNVWQWAEAIAASHSRDATVLSLLGTLGATLRFSEGSDCSEIISENRLETLFRQSLDLDPVQPGNFGMAGNFFMFMENYGEAERCYARGFRLDRSDDQLAVSLAKLYQKTDRQREALFVLDMCLREGGEVPEVSWRAALTAFHLQQYEAAITYLDRYESGAPGEPWVNYYRTGALIELNRPAEALVANDEEKRRNPNCPYHVSVYRACALAKLGRSDEFRRALVDVLELRLADVGYLSPQALRYLLEHLWKPVADLQEHDPLQSRFEDLVLAAGLAPRALFDRRRKASGEALDVNYYECELTQKLDSRWPTWPGCLFGEEEWKSYHVVWGVLARSSEEAEQFALQWQGCCFPLPSTLVEVELLGEQYRDVPGVVWQGDRIGVTED